MLARSVEKSGENEPPLENNVLEFRPRSARGSDGFIPLRAANDNDRFDVIDDLPRPLPIMRGEGDLVRKLLGEQFLYILKGEGS
jgi:hypothetical protein